MLSTLHKAPYALACWAGVAGRDRRRGARILMGHGTPARLAWSLERQLRYLRRQFEVVSLEELVRRLSSEDNVDGLVALTFDDGLRSNVAIAYPILRRLGIPATFFVCPQLVEERRWIWTTEARWRLKALGQEADSFVERMKGMPETTRRTVESALRRATASLQPAPHDREALDLATWDDLRLLDPALITIGSHTLTHAMLPCADPVAMEAEVAVSRRLLENTLQRQVHYFCYPNGQSSPAVADEVKRSYRAAVGTERGSIFHGADLHRLPRLHLTDGALRLASRLHAAVPA